jgi:hypothetical protein
MLIVAVDGDPTLALKPGLGFEREMVNVSVGSETASLVIGIEIVWLVAPV